MIEHFFQCPHCWEQISMLIDTSQEHQKYIEDCEICCNPIELIITVFDQKIDHFQANSIE